MTRRSCENRRVIRYSVQAVPITHAMPRARTASRDCPKTAMADAISRVEPSGLWSQKVR